MKFDFVSVAMLIANIALISFVRKKQEKQATILFIVFYIALLIHLFFTGDIRFFIFGMIASIELFLFELYKLKD